METIEGVSFHVEIAEVAFAINGIESALPYEFPQEYRSFLAANSSRGEVVSVTVNPGMRTLPDADKMEKVFDTGEAWSMFREKGDYVLVVSAPDKRIVCFARLNRSLKEANIYCSPELMHGSAGTPRTVSPFFYPVDQIMLMYCLADREGAIIHASGLVTNEKAPSQTSFPALITLRF
jgi:hypothetical protein